MSVQSRQTVLILGAGINGCAAARELLLNGIPVCIVDVNDIAWGATSRSSRLIHGGLRYLEYGDFRLVRESLQERMLLRRLAPQFVEPLRLYIPVRRRFAGLVRSVFRFLGVSRVPLLQRLTAAFGNSSDRGLWLVRMGLWFYDRFASGRGFPKHGVKRADAAGVPQVDPTEYHWLCAYTDGQMRFPERFVVALLEDARRIAVDNNIDFQIWTYHRAVREEGRFRIERCADGALCTELEPALVINATGAWGDLTLDRLQVESPQLFGGTKGSHFVSYAPRLREALGSGGLYAEAKDGRLIFLLPFGESVLVGTTDEHFAEPPDRAVADESELDYLLGMVNQLFPQFVLTRDDIDMHYSGVRPLPRSSAEKVASISRDHSIEEQCQESVPVWTLVGGKLTTARAFAEEIAGRVCRRLEVPHQADSRLREIPGGKDYPVNEEGIAAECERIAENFGLEQQSVAAMWTLCGNCVETILEEIDTSRLDLLEETELPVAFVRWVIAHEWVTTLGDLIERRLMLIYQQNLSQRTLRQLAECLVQSGLLEPTEFESAVKAETERLKEYYGKTVTA